MLDCHICDGQYSPIGSYENIYRCSGCDHIYRIYEGDNFAYHKNQYRKDSRFFRDNNEYNKDGSINSRFHEARKGMVSARKERIREILDEEYTCFDIGAGAGTFLAEIKDDIKEAYCNEVALSLIQECQRLGFETYAGDFLTLEIPKTYDIVFAWHVLEHIEDIYAFKEKLLKMTNKYCVVEVPTLESMDSRETKKRTLLSPTDENWDGHVHYFSSSSLKKFFENEFKIIKYEPGVQDPAILCVMEKR